MISSELSTGRMDPRVGSGSGHEKLPDFGGSGQVGSGQHFGFISFSLLFLGT